MVNWLLIKLEQQTFLKGRETINLDEEIDCVNHGLMLIMNYANLLPPLIYLIYNKFFNLLAKSFSRIEKYNWHDSGSQIRWIYS